MLKKFILAILLIGLLSACEKIAENNTVFEEQMFVMGTIVNVTLYGEEEKKSQKVFHNLLKDFKYMQAAWNPWKKGSLGRINSLLPHGEDFSIGPALKDIIVTSAELSEQSEGLFNPAIGQLIKLWQFNKDELPAGPPPSEAQIKNWLTQQASMTDLEVGELSLKTNNPAVILDFGAFAKGYAVDKAIEYLLLAGVENAIINAGGDLRAIGSKNGKPWVIGIRDPRADGVIAVAEIQGDESVFTSGDYERFYDYQGKRYHHILDPRTGYPAMETTSVTVLHKKAAVADAAATALFVAGPNDWTRIARKMGVDKVMLIDKQGKIYLTPEMQKRIRLQNEEKRDISVVSLDK